MRLVPPPTANRLGPRERLVSAIALPQLGSAVALTHGPSEEAADVLVEFPQRRFDALNAIAHVGLGVGVDVKKVEGQRKLRAR